MEAAWKQSGEGKILYGGLIDINKVINNSKELSNSCRFIHIFQWEFVCSWLFVFLCGLVNRSRDA
jgi:hypothetical protein